MLKLEIKKAFCSDATIMYTYRIVESKNITKAAFVKEQNPHNGERKFIRVADIEDLKSIEDDSSDNDLYRYEAVEINYRTLEEAEKEREKIIDSLKELYKNFMLNYFDDRTETIEIV